MGVFVFILFLLFLVSCGDRDKKVVIGVLISGEGRVYDVWITFGSVHEVRAFRERKIRSLCFRGLVEILSWRTMFR